MVQFHLFLSAPVSYEMVGYMYEVLIWKLNYRKFHLLANLGWVDFDLGCSTILLGQ